ncbi:MAG: GCN5-like N-acetyltransferase [Propionibacteriaceae bacterium]|nr:GCN5-like N-acetyltransferase [Propionibacteriaceae bacterium]
MELPVLPALPLHTERLVLRRFGPGDLEPLLAFHSDADSVRYVPFPPRDRAAVASVLERKTSNFALRREGDLIELAVALRKEGTLVGDVLLALRSLPNETLEVGYIFSPAYAGRGYATEAVRALLDLAFGPLGARRVMARVDERNARSRALLERLGARLEAHLVENEWIKGELTSEVDYAVLAREWGVPKPRSPELAGGHRGGG